ncbi:MAG: ABC transporter permease [Bacteroidia bacterium]
MTLKDHINIAFESIKGNRTRATITALIISIGLMALVGILTATDGIEASINDSFSNMGANTFNIKNRGNNVHFGVSGRANKKYKTITKNEADEFKKNYAFPSVTSLSVNATWNSTIKYESYKTEPNVMVMGGDEKYLDVSGYDIQLGRNFSDKDITSAANVCLVGQEIKTKLFKSKIPIGESIFVGGAKYRVIGLLKTKGTAAGFGGDRIVIVPLENARQVFARPNMSFVITVAVKDVPSLNNAVDEATSVFRRVRRIAVSADDNFEIMKSDNIAKELINSLSYVTIAATVIGFITLVGAAVGLMNIMLVSVTERTREIGVRKAIGAKGSEIRRQFLIEAITICQIGGLGGIILGIAAGNIVSVMLHGNFIIPWFWMIAGLLLCYLVGLISGIYPAIKASKLDPIEALRYE